MNVKELRVKVGLEIHQQLATNSKLFCSCKPIEVEEHEHQFFRRLRPTKSELGEYDPAALFEFKKGRIIRYLASNSNSCLVEADEEPPHDLSAEALETSLILALTLNANIVDEVHVMRKIVIDGSNTTGFQRTMLIAIGGEIDGVKVQTISLEEDAARIVDESDKMKSYALDRLGVPLIEIALEPVTMEPEGIAELALKLGRLLRASKRVARGLGTIRQDVNISIVDGNVIEVKGVQRLDQLKSVIEYEMKRQHGLMIIADMLKMDDIKFRVEDVSSIFKDSKAKVIKKALLNGVVKAIKIQNFAGMLGFEPYEGIRLGRELGELVRFYGLGGIFHSDELPAYGINEKELDAVKERLDTDDKDAIIIVAGRSENVNYAIDAIIDRLREALKGVPAETRAVVNDRTVYSRPRPGAARMYPETDIPPVVISEELLNSLQDKVPRSWDEYIEELSRKYKINKVLSEKIFDSDYQSLFEEIAKYNIPATFIASILTETIVSLEREGYDSSRLNDDMLIDIFTRLEKGEIAKESVEKILEAIMSKCSNVDEAIKVLGIEKMDEVEIDRIIDNIINDNINIIKEKGDRAFSILMGKAMSRLRGKVDGERVSMLIKEKISKYK
jgi:glutamyl-tRNA(Gln) amidotransferase subunit E